VRQQDAYPANAGGGAQLQLCSTPPLPFSRATLKISVAHCMSLSTRLKGSRMMSPPGFQV